MNNVSNLKLLYPPVASPILHRAPQVSISDVYTHPPEPQRFLIEEILPGGVLTLLGAHGGAGKSTLALIAVVCLVTGRPFLGLRTEKCRVVFYSGEDPAPVIRRRVSRICRHMNVSPCELSNGLLMLDATESPTLYNGAKTNAFAALALDVKEYEPGVIIIDNASDTFDSNEIERARVREFVRLLASLGTAGNAAVLLLAHIDKATAKVGAGGEGYSGSTAWHNSARSRLFLTTKNDGLILEHQKSNLGPRAESIHLKWTDGGMLEHAAAPGGADDRATVLQLIGDAYARNDFISTAPNAANNAYKVLGGSPQYPCGLSRAGLNQLFRQLELEHAIIRESYSTGHRNVRDRFAIPRTALSASSLRQVEPAALNAQPTR